MRSWIRLIARLYPKDWRQRYGTEFDALLEDARPRWRDGLDILWGALEMHMMKSTFPKLAAVCSLVGAIVAAGVALWMQDKYISEAVLRVTSTDRQSRQYFRDRVLQRALSRNSLGELILENDLYATDRQRMTLDDVIERMRHDIAITLSDSAAADPQHFALVVRYVYRDPAQAQNTTNILVAKMITANLVEAAEAADQAERKADYRRVAITLRLVDPPSLPRRPAGRNRLLITTLVIGIALVLAVLGAVSTRLRRPAAQR